jgi:hypothetical protein
MLCAIGQGWILCGLGFQIKACPPHNGHLYVAAHAMTFLEYETLDIVSVYIG